MLGRYRSDIWHPGILHAPISHVLGCTSFNDIPVTWLPSQPPFCFLADPFGLWHNGALHVLAEYYDYRTKHGRIQYVSYNAEFKAIDQGEALAAPHHLSYPFLIQDGGDIYMLPEAHRSGALSLYRATAFPKAWEKVCDLISGPVVDASVIQVNGTWWMFYTLDGADQRAMRELYIASAPRLTGPWTPANAPALISLETARPGGTPFIHDDAVYLPTQDCRTEYGAAVNVLRLNAIEPFAATPVQKITPAFLNTPFTDGLHTLSACGDVTLFDVKHIDRSPRRAVINLQRRWRRLTR